MADLLSETWRGNAAELVRREVFAVTALFFRLKEVPRRGGARALFDVAVRHVFEILVNFAFSRLISALDLCDLVRSELVGSSLLLGFLDGQILQRFLDLFSLRLFVVESQLFVLPFDDDAMPCLSLSMKPCMVSRQWAVGAVHS